MADEPKPEGAEPAAGRDLGQTCRAKENQSLDGQGAWREQADQAVGEISGPAEHQQQAEGARQIGRAKDKIAEERDMDAEEDQRDVEAEQV